MKIMNDLILLVLAVVVIAILHLPEKAKKKSI